MTNSTIKAPKTAPKTNKQPTIKDLKESILTSAITNTSIAQELKTKIAQEDPDRAASKSRIARMSEAGSLADCHGQKDSLMTGFTAKDLQVIKLLTPKLDADLLTNKSKREEKAMLLTAVPMLVQKTFAPNFSELNSAAQKISSDYVKMTKAKNTMRCLFEVISLCEAFTENGIVYAMDHETNRQAGVCIKFCKIYNIVDITNDGYKDILKFKNDHPFIKAVREFAKVKPFPAEFKALIVKAGSTKFNYITK